MPASIEFSIKLFVCLSVCLSADGILSPKYLDTDAAPAGERDADCEQENECETVVPSVKKRKINKKGQKVLGNGAVAMRELELASQAPPKNRNDDAAQLLKAELSLSKASTVFTLVIHAKNMPIDKGTTSLVASSFIQQPLTA
jgi:hypothetical protein